MTLKELRKAKKDELIEMLFFLRKEVDELKEENTALRAKLLIAGAVPGEDNEQI